MYDGMRAVDPALGAFFVLEFVVGTYIFVSLFLSVLISQFTMELDGDKTEETKEVPGQGRSLEIRIKSVCICLHRKLMEPANK